eukprot:95796-Chlamydomonas_euryale.AAC.1
MSTPLNSFSGFDACMLQNPFRCCALATWMPVTRTPLVRQGRHPRLCAPASEQASHQQSSWRDTR